MKITPVLIVEKIEPLLPFWLDRLGFEKTVEVPGDDGLAFVIFQHGTAELMFQTRASAEKDVPQIAGDLKPRPGTFIEVDDFDDLLKRVDGLEVVMPERTTFYGMREIMVREPGGNIICFAARV
jgi:uncharacterized glyoxalase superfamily protein PhnB